MKNSKRTYILSTEIGHVIYGCERQDELAVFGYIEDHNDRVEAGEVSDAWELLSEDAGNFPTVWERIKDMESQLTVSE